MTSAPPPPPANVGRRPGKVPRAPRADAAERRDALRQHHNPLYERYYRQLQRIHLSPADPAAGAPSAEAEEATWKRFIDSMRVPLPTTIWINDTDPFAIEVCRFFQSSPKDAVDPIPWFPHKLHAGECLPMGWRVALDKKAFP